MNQTLDQFFRNHLEKGVAIERITLHNDDVIVCLVTTNGKDQLICVLPIVNLDNSPEGRKLYQDYHIITLPLTRVKDRVLPNRYEKLCYLNACFDTYVKHIKRFFSQECLDLLRRLRASL